MPSSRVDGNDVYEVREVVAAAVERARAGEGPTFIEALTYRHGGHSRADPATYRPEDEVAAWKRRDPIDLLGARLVKEFDVSEAELRELSVETERTVQAAHDAALNAPFPAPEKLYSDCLAPTGM
jgi:acetoin:2,6-dichlorophenolindophenol oxidoreductase subunit alpha